MLQHIKKLFGIKPKAEEAKVEVPYKVEAPVEPTPVAVQATEAMVESVAPAKKARKPRAPKVDKAPAVKKPRAPRKPKAE